MRYILIVIPGQAGVSQRDPESRNSKKIWIPASAGMTWKTGWLV